MSGTYIPEICDSLFKHHQMVEIDKPYYQRPEDGKILCGECIEPWFIEQSNKIFNRLKPWILGALAYRDEGKLGDGQNIESSGTVPVVNYMAPVIGPIGLHFILSDEDGMSVDLTIGSEFKTHFTIVEIEEGEWGESDEEALLEKIQGILELYATIEFPKMDPEVVSVIVDTLGALYTSTSANPESSCGCDDTPETFGECAVCGKGLTKPYYIYYNQGYCVDCMYAIVVKIAIKSNLSEIVGIAQPDEPPLPSNPIPYQNTKEWRMGVIDKFFLFMKNNGIWDPDTPAGYRVN